MSPFSMWVRSFCAGRSVLVRGNKKVGCGSGLGRHQVVPTGFGATLVSISRRSADPA